MRNYFAIVFESPTGGFIIDFPDLPECVAFADSFGVARAMAACALADHIDELMRLARLFRGRRLTTRYGVIHKT
jgi:predicted RNase H-like HicB family nuclease